MGPWDADTPRLFVRNGSNYLTAAFVHTRAVWCVAFCAGVFVRVCNQVLGAAWEHKVAVALQLQRQGKAYYTINEYVTVWQ